MTTKCKIGDLCYVTKSEVQEQNGMVVEIIGPGFFIDSWEVTFRGVVRGFFGEVLIGSAYCPDHCLRPITGLPITDDVTDDEKVPA